MDPVKSVMDQLQAQGFSQGWWGSPALVDHKATYTGHCRQGELKTEWESHRVQTYDEKMTKTKLHTKTQGKRQKLPCLSVDGFISKVHLK